MGIAFYRRARQHLGRFAQFHLQDTADLAQAFGKFSSAVSFFQNKDCISASICNRKLPVPHIRESVTDVPDFIFSQTDIILMEKF